MPKSERQRQKKLAAKKSKQRQQKQAFARQKQRQSTLMGRMQTASNGEVLHSYVGTSVEESNGMSAIILVRKGPQGQNALANFLVDRWCLGVKDCFGKLASPSECSEILDNFDEKLDLERVAPDVAHAIVVGGVEYARSLGFMPHPDYTKLEPIWTGIPIGDIPLGLEFGCEGQPRYIVGPYDDDAKQAIILGTLSETVGHGNFDFISRERQEIEQELYQQMLEAELDFYEEN